MTETSVITLEKTTTNRGLRWRRYFFFFISFVFLFYLLSLIVINTSWAKNKLTNRLKAKTNTEWNVGNVLWVPFGNIGLNDLTTKMGEGGIHLESISVSPEWRELLSGSASFSEAAISKADVDLDLQWIKENLSEGDEIIQSLPLSDEQPKKPVVKPKSPSTGKPAEVRPPARPESKPTQRDAGAEKLAEKLVENDTPNQWLRLDELNLTLRNGDFVAEEIFGISAVIPFAGKPADGELRVNFLNVEHGIKLKWNGRELSAGERMADFYGFSHQWKAVFRISQPGMPFIIRFIAPEQKLDQSIDKPNFHWNVKADVMAANIDLNGSLRNFNTWRGIMTVVAEKMVIKERQKIHKRVEFDNSRFLANLSNGMLKIPIAEAVGDEVSFLANGVIHKNLYTYGVLRLVTNDELSAFFQKVYKGSRFIEIVHKPFHFTLPLDTLDRRSCDIYLDGKLTNLDVRHERGDKWMRLNSAIHKLWDFKNNELKEDGLLER